MVDVESSVEAWAVAGRAEVHGYTLRVVREVRCNFSRRLKVSNMSDSLIVAGNLFHILSVLYGLPASTLAPLQRVQNAAARLVLRLDHRAHIKPALQSLH